VFPTTAISPLGEPFKWYSTFSVEAEDDLCPDRGDFLDLVRLTFPES
jgi:hypothetical protein